MYVEKNESVSGRKKSWDFSEPGRYFEAEEGNRSLEIPGDAGQHSRAQFSEKNMGKDIIGHIAEGQVFWGEGRTTNEDPEKDKDLRTILILEILLPAI